MNADTEFGGEEVSSSEQTARWDTETAAEEIETRRIVVVPFGQAGGFIARSFGLNLSAKAAMNLSRVMNGMALTGINLRDANDALNRILESIDN